MKLVVESVFHSMISGIMKDGVSRRLGNYFTLQLEVKGGFDELGNQFDPQKHKLAMTVRPLEEFRHVACEVSRVPRRFLGHRLGVSEE